MNHFYFLIEKNKEGVFETTSDAEMDEGVARRFLEENNKLEWATDAYLAMESSHIITTTEKFHRLFVSRHYKVDAGEVARRYVDELNNK